MTEGICAAVALLVLVWAVFSGALSRHNVTGPLLFVASGYFLSNPDWGPLPVGVETTSVKVVAEVTLALVLFADAARVNVRELRREWSVPVRLLAIGLPLSVLLGTGLAVTFFNGMPVALALFIGAALAPTDAALSASVISDERIPMRLRRALNVESGLNDGIVTPIVTVALALAAAEIGVVNESGSHEATTAVRDLGGGVLVGLVVGLGGAVLITWTARHDWTASGGRRLAVLALAAGAYAFAVAIGGNGFIAAFVAGVAFGSTLHDDVRDLERVYELPELGGELLALVVWFLFGAVLLPVAFRDVDARTVLYALLSLTIVRIVPVGLSLLHAGIDRPSVAFVGWFGPRGLASVVFALLAIEELGQNSGVANDAIAVVALTVLFSVVLHGLTAGPGGRRYVQAEQRDARPGPRPRALLGDREPSRSGPVVDAADR